MNFALTFLLWVFSKRYDLFNNGFCIVYSNHPNNER